jgi:hypothetical protein
MYHSSHGGSGDIGAGMAGAFVSLFLILLIVAAVLLLISLFILFRCALLIGRVFYKDPKNRTLWRSLGLCLLLCLVGGLLTAVFISPGFLVLAGLGVLQFLITCKVVELDNTQLFLREKNDMVDQIIHPKSWWQDYNA